MRATRNLLVLLIVGATLIGVAFAQRSTSRKRTKPRPAATQPAPALPEASISTDAEDLRAQLERMKANLARVKTTDRSLKKQLALEASLLEAMLLELERLQSAAPQQIEAVPSEPNTPAGIEGELEIISNPPDAAVYVDGVAIGATPLRMPAKIGTREVTLVKPGYFENQARVNITADQRTMHSVKMNRLWGEAAFAFSPESKGFVEVKSNPPGAQIWMDGRRSPRGTPFKFPSPSGEHTLELRMDGFMTLVKKVTVAPGKTLELTETLEPYGSQPEVAKAQQEEKPPQ